MRRKNEEEWRKLMGNMVYYEKGKHSNNQYSRGTWGWQMSRSLFKDRMTENFQKLEKDTTNQVQEDQRSPLRFNTTKSAPWSIVVKFPTVKDKEKILKAAKGKEQITHKGVWFNWL